jgi:hypothetical protein
LFTATLFDFKWNILMIGFCKFKVY